MKQLWIYRITNVITNRVYIGQTNNLYDRLKAHKSCRDKKTIIVKSIQKYGWENHVVDILFNSDGITRKEADVIEKYYIKKLNTYAKNNPLGMNLTEGGYGGNPLPEVYKKRSIKEFKEWKLKLGKSEIDVLIFDLGGNFILRFDGIDFKSAFVKLNINTTIHGVRKALKDRGYGVVLNKYIFGFEDCNPYQKYLQRNVIKGAYARKHGVKKEVIEILNNHRKEKQQVPVLDLNTGVYFETTQDFCNYEKRSAATIRERFENGKYDGKYMLCKN